MSAIHAAHAAATIVKIRALTNMGTFVAGDEGRIEPNQGTQEEDETMADSGEYEGGSGSREPLSNHEGDESFACGRDPLVLKLGHTATGETNNLSFRESRLDSRNRDPDHAGRLVGQIPDH